MEKLYELTVLLHPDLEIDLEKPLAKVEKIITDNGGKIAATDNWGKKRLAYAIKKQDFAVAYDDKPNYTAYRGFEDSTITLEPTFNGYPVSGVTYQYSSNYIVINGNNLSVKTKSLAGKTDETKDTVVVTARYQNYSAVFTVIIEPWYIVTKANEFGDGAIIDQNLSGRFKLGNNINFNAIQLYQKYYY